VRVLILAVLFIVILVVYSIIKAPDACAHCERILPEEHEGKCPWCGRCPTGA